MSNPYSIDGMAVLKDGRAVLTRGEVVEFATLAVRRRKRKKVEFRRFMKDFLEHGRASYNWNFLKHRQAPEYYDVTLTVESCADGFLLACTNGLNANGYGPTYVLSRVASILRSRIPVHLREPRPRRDVKTIRKPRKKKVYISRIDPAPIQTRKIRTQRKRITAAISFVRNEKLTPQFRRQRFFWNEAATAVVQIFDLKNGAKRTALQKAAKALHDSLERNGGSFAQFKRRGFTLRFDLIDGIWRGDITPLSIVATKDNRHPLYQRMREYFRDVLGHLSATERKERHEKYTQVTSLAFGVTMLHGWRYAA